MSAGRPTFTDPAPRRVLAVVSGVLGASVAGMFAAPTLAILAVGVLTGGMVYRGIGRYAETTWR